jgi:hypothetical protein
MFPVFHELGVALLLILASDSPVYKIGDLGLMSDAVSTKIFMDGDCRLNTFFYFPCDYYLKYY